MGHDVQVFVASFGSESGAGDALAKLRDMERNGAIELVSAAAISRGLDGQVAVTQSTHPDGETSGSSAAANGTHADDVFPRGMLLSAAIAAGDASLWQALQDEDRTDDGIALARVGEVLQPGSSAILAVFEDRVMARFEEGLADYEGLASFVRAASAATITSRQ